MSRDSLVEKVESASADGFSVWSLLELAGYGIGIATSLPLGVTIAAGAIIADLVSKQVKLSETRMPDDWLKDVAECKQVSSDGLAHLAKCVERKGFVSAKDALIWIRIERDKELAAKEREEKAERLASSGAVALLERASKECTGLFDAESLKRAMDKLPTVKDVGDLFNKATSFFKR